MILSTHNRNINADFENAKTLQKENNLFKRNVIQGINIFKDINNEVNKRSEVDIASTVYTNDTVIGK